MRLTKIYTKIGDKGSTMLASGERVSKASLRIDSYGCVDELNAVMGMLRDTLTQVGSIPTEDLIEKIARVQNELFDIGGELATPGSALDISRQQVVTMASTTQLETEIDAMNVNLPPLENFILPGGHIVNSTAHLARTVCRRAERSVVALSAQETVRDEPRIYLNRLSDWLFVLGRETSRRLGVPEVLWRQKR